jgi:hypothetical protein
MKKLFLFFVVLFSFSQLMAQDTAILKLNPNKKVMIVDASCGQCQFKMAGKGCTLAVKINGQSYFVDKANIDAFGDAHSETGFCNAVRKAKVQGEIVGGKFVASFFELVDKK